MASLRAAHPSRETLSEYHDGELDAQTRLEVRRHLLECATCQEYLEDLQSGSSLYQRLPALRPPMSLRGDTYRRIDSADEARRGRSWLPLPGGGGLSLPNLAGVVAVSLLLAFLIPQLAGVWSVVSAIGGRAPQSAARPVVEPASAGPAADAPAPDEGGALGTPPEAVPLPDAPLVEPLVTVAPPPPSPVPSATAIPASPTAAPASTAANTTGAPAGRAPAQPSATPRAAPGQPGQPGQAPAPPAATATKAPPAPTQTAVPASPTAVPASPTAVRRVVSGQISAVDRRQRRFSVFSPEGNRTWQVVLPENAAVVQKDGQPLTFEDVGLADQVEVAGVDDPQSAATVSASTVKVLVSAVAPSGGRRGRVLFLLDGADGLRPPQYGYTGDWIKRLNDTGYAVTALEPARLSSGRYDLTDVNLIVIGYPATLSPNAIQLVTSSNKPVLNAEPRLVQALGLGLNVDPQQPARDVVGRTVDIAGQASPVSGGLKGETALAAGNLHRFPIVASGAVLASISEGGQRRTVWSATGSAMYLGVFASDGGQNHNATYWALFDRAVLWLLGRDPSTVTIPGGAVSCLPGEYPVTATDATRLRFCFNLDRARLAQCFAPETLAAIGELVELDAATPEQLTDDWLRPRLAAADGCITGWGSLPLDAARLAGAPRLRYALHAAGSVKSIVVDDAVWERGLRVTSAANANGVPVAEFALGLVLCALKDVFRYQVAFKRHGQGAWQRAVTTPGYYRTTVGVIGAGNVGRHLLGLLRHHDFRVLVYDPWLEDAAAADLGATRAGLEELLRASRAVVLVAPNIPQNAHLIGAAQLALLPDGATLINPGRGALLDHDALIAELRTGRISACLDVADPEPPPAGSPLYSLPNCILTPHVAGSLNAECLRLGAQVLEEVRRLVSGRPFQGEVTRELFPRLG